MSLPATKGPLKLDRVTQIIEKRLEQEAMVLDVLVAAAAKGNALPELWAQLHIAAVRDNRIAELALAYEQIVGAARVKLLAASVQADVFTHAAVCLEEILGDAHKAQEYLSRALQAVPAHAEAFTRLEAILCSRQDATALIEFYSSAASHRSSPAEQLSLLRKAAELADYLPGENELAIKLCQQIVRLDPSDLAAIEALEGQYVRAGRYRDAAKWFEQLLLSRPACDEAAEMNVRERLLRLYRDELAEIDRALPHVERLLGRDPSHGGARELGERLLQNKSLAWRAATILADSYEKVGDFEAAANMLTAQLEHARGTRRLEVQRRLAALRQDRLHDLAGALAALQEIVVADVADEDVRRRFQQVSAQLDQRAAASRVLSTAAAGLKDSALRMRIQSELAQYSLEGGDRDGARGAFEEVLAEATDEAAILTAARGLSSVYGSDEGEALARVLELVVRLEPDDIARWSAAERLARLYQTALGDPARAAAAWRALLPSPIRAQALDELEKLCEATGADGDLAGILDLRAQEEPDRDKSRALAFRAADLRARRANPPAASIPIWREFLNGYGPSREVHARIIPLLEQEENFGELVKVLKEESLLMPESERLPVLTRIGEIALDRLKDLPMATDALRSVLAIDSKNKMARRTLERLLASKQGRLLAAEVLEPLYRREGDGRALLVVLEAQLQACTEVGARLLILDEAVRILDEGLGELPGALQLAGNALRKAIRHEPNQIPVWMQRIEQLSQKLHDPSGVANVLARALGDHPIDSPALSTVAQRAGEALLAAGDAARALAMFRAALAYDPAAEALSTRVNELVMQQGSPAERIAVHTSRLDRVVEPTERRVIHRQIATIQERELCDTPAAIATLQTALAEDPTDQVAQDMLLEAYAAQGDTSALYAELERVLATAQGERRTATLLKMAQSAVQSGQPERALSHYRELLSSVALPEGVLGAIERAADDAGDANTLRDVLERRIVAAIDRRTEVECLERLGDLQANRLSDAEAALTSWKRAARVCDQAAIDPDRARGVYAKIVAADPKDREASRRLIELYTQGGDANKLTELYGNLLRHATDEREALNLVVAMEPWAAEGATSSEYSQAVDTAFKGYLDAASRRLTGLLTAKARVLSADSTKADEAARLFRSLIGASREEAEPIVASFDAFLSGAAPSATRLEDQRWLEIWRAKQLPELDQIQALLTSASAHEKMEDRSAAIEAYRHVLEVDPDRIAARFAIVRLMSEMGDVQGALAAMADLRDRTYGDVRAGLEVKMGRVLAEQLDRPEEALTMIAPVLEAAPDDPTVVSIIARALGRSASRDRAVAMLERASEHAETPARAEAILRILVDAPAGDSELSASRQRWFSRLLALQTAEPRVALDTALQAVSEFVEDEGFWDVAERMARELRDPAPVADAYRRALERSMNAEIAETIGRRAIDFHEEWFEDREVVINLLKRLEELHEGRWAFDRLKLVLSAEERYDDLFALYDRAIEKAATSTRIELLEEAAEGAKDFARDSDRAIDYLERLSSLRPLQGSTLGALERLYERKGHHSRLIELLTKRLDELGPESDPAQRTRFHIASLCLKVGDRSQAFRHIEEILGRDSKWSEAYELLAQVLMPAQAAEANGSGGRVANASPARASDSDRGWSEPPPTERLPRPIVTRAAALLKAHYFEESRKDDVIRVLEVELASAETTEERIALHRELGRLRLDSLDQHQAAFQNITALVMLEPQVEENRSTLAELAAHLGQYPAMAEVLVRAAETCSESRLKAALLVEAADTFRERLGDVTRATALYRQVVEFDGIDSAFVLSTARQLEPLLASQNLAAEQCGVLEKIASLETHRPARSGVLGRLAHIASDVLSDHDRAARAWRARLGDDAEDREALDGLVLVLEKARLWSDLIAALEGRARVADAAQARKDSGQVARIYAEQHGAPGQAISTWKKVREVHGPDDESFRELSILLENANQFRDLADLTEEEARAASSTERRVALWARLGDIYRERLLAMDRAAASYSEALLLSPKDGVARRGLALAETNAEARPAALAALARAYVATGEWDPAAELASKLRPGEEVPADIGRAFWWGVTRFCRDIRRNLDLAESSLLRALAFDADNAQMLEALAAIQSRSPGRNFVLTTIHLSEVKGGDLQLLREAADVALRSSGDALLCRDTCEKLLELAIVRWTKGSNEPKKQGAERAERSAAAWALQQLVSAAQEAGDDRHAVELLKRGASLPFAASETRRMKREAALISSERLKDFDTALAIYRDLFREHAGDEAATSSIDAFAALLDTHLLHEELVSLWEQQAALAAAAKDASTSAGLWERAARLAAERLGDTNRVVADYRQGAALGGMASLEALARIYTERGEHAEAASCLERICEHSREDALVENTLRLADAYDAAGQLAMGRARLERTLSELKASASIADRLGRLYERDGDWEALAGLLTSQAAQTGDPAARLSYLARAVELQGSKLQEPSATIPLLEQLVELEPDNAARRLSLAEALLHANRTDDAIRVLDAQIERYGSRKPKDRALIHYALARATSDRKRAVHELEIASRIDPAHAGVLHSLARLASDDNRLDLAEHTYHALLLLRRGAREDSEHLNREQILMDLAEIADRKKDPERAAELRASANEARSLRPPPSSERPERSTDRPKPRGHGRHPGRSRPTGGKVLG